jgi:hypothetical protein
MKLSDPMHLLCRQKDLLEAHSGVLSDDLVRRN